jgi:oleate hydratase
MILLFPMHYECYWELLSHVPSLEDESISVRDESFEFNKRFVSNGQARLLKEGKKIDVSSYGLSLKQQSDFFHSGCFNVSSNIKIDINHFISHLKLNTFLLQILLHGSNNRVILTFVAEESLGNKRIMDWFDAKFFETNFWYIWTSMFAFQKWSSLTI